MPEIPLAVALIGTSLLSAGTGIYSANKAASAQGQAASAAANINAKAYEEAKNAQLSMFNTSKDLAQPFIDTGLATRNTLTNLITPGPNQTDTLEQIPGFTFTRDQGLKAVTNQATSRGISGNALREGANFATGLASNTWSDLVNKLIATTQLGSNAATSVGQQAVSTGSNIGTSALNAANNAGNAVMGRGNAQAAADIATGNAVSNASGNFTNLAVLDKLTNGKLFGTSGMYGKSDATSSGDA